MTHSRHKNIRMSMWDYSNPAVYMVTFCVQDRIHRLGAIDAENRMHLSLAGKMVTQEIDALPDLFPKVDLDYYVVMPNHIHLLVGLNLDMLVTKSISLGQVIGALKSRTTVRYIRGVKKGYLPPFRGRLWQVGYYETVMRNERMAEEYRYYISNNPAAWEDDPEIKFVPEPLDKVSEAE